MDRRTMPIPPRLRHEGTEHAVTGASFRESSPTRLGLDAEPHRLGSPRSPRNSPSCAPLGPLLTEATPTRVSCAAHSINVASRPRSRLWRWWPPTPFRDPAIVRPALPIAKGCFELVPVSCRGQLA